MKGILHSCMILLLLTPFSLKGQGDDVVFKGDYQDMPFEDFVKDVEQKAGLHFYYLESWIRGIRVTASGEEISLRRTLNQTLLPAGLYYFMEHSGEIYLSNRQALTGRLPDYSGSGATSLTAGEQEGSGLTSTEQKYIDGRKAGMLETFSVGNR